MARKRRTAPPATRAFIQRTWSMWKRFNRWLLRSGEPPPLADLVLWSEPSRTSSSHVECDRGCMIDDPVVAYDQLAPYYSHFTERRAAYLRSVEQQIAARIPAGATSLLDIGAG